ncbi:hypothetical protein BP6252_13338 [Coleophoma cylindrospora]|uniref:Uncharacterized protein n=1 Tax=Coleophoma cylindrospora TaxID=1849047 RepID=A0A3D8QAJ4_9HELO|nr:hypothetical protein BP6252_13338 [Coleophoma cylindrospora]
MGRTLLLLAFLRLILVATTVSAASGSSYYPFVCNEVCQANYDESFYDIYSIVDQSYLTRGITVSDGSWWGHAVGVYGEPTATGPCDVWTLLSNSSAPYGGVLIQTVDDFDTDIYIEYNCTLTEGYVLLERFKCTPGQTIHSAWTLGVYDDGKSWLQYDKQCGDTLVTGFLGATDDTYARGAFVFYQHDIVVQTAVTTIYKTSTHYAPFQTTISSWTTTSTTTSCIDRPFTYTDGWTIIPTTITVVSGTTTRTVPSTTNWVTVTSTSIIEPLQQQTVVVPSMTVTVTPTIKPPGLSRSDKIALGVGLGTGLPAIVFTGLDAMLTLNHAWD